MMKWARGLLYVHLYSLTIFISLQKQKPFKFSSLLHYGGFHTTGTFSIEFGLFWDVVREQMI
jgi:hypothetical protein